MVLKKFVKVGAISNLSDARYCAGMGVTLLGFLLKKGNLQVLELNDFKAISGWIEGAEFVGEFIDVSDQEILEQYKELKFDYVQTNDYQQSIRLADKGLLVLYYGNVSSDMTFDHLAYLILDDLNDAPTKDYSKILLGGAVSTDQIDSLDSVNEEIGIHLLGGEEERPGYKSFDELADILEYLETED